LQKEIGTLRIENAQLITRSRILVRETRDLRRTNATYVDDNKALTERIHTLEHRTLDLLETITEKEGSIQIQLIKQIYKEQILTLRNENAALSKKKTKPYAIPLIVPFVSLKRPIVSSDPVATPFALTVTNKSKNNGPSLQNITKILDLLAPFVGTR